VKRSSDWEPVGLKKEAQLTFSIDAGEYLKWSEANKKSYPEDKSRYENHLKFLGDIRLKDISPLMLEKLRRDLKKKDLSSATIHHVLTLIRAIFRKAVAWKLYNGPIPTNEVRFPRLNNKRTRFLSHKETDILLKKLEKVSFQVYCQSAIALYCGLRFGEIANLTWADVDVVNGVMQIRGAKGGDRHAYITEPVNEILEDKPNGQNTLIFPDKKGKKQKVDTLPIEHISCQNIGLVHRRFINNPSHQQYHSL
jgi:integrase